MFLKKTANIFIGILVLNCSCNERINRVETISIKVDAPFEMNPIQIPEFEKARKFSIIDYGAIKENQASVSKAIKMAITEAHNQNGGVVIIPEGKWKTGKIHLKSNVNLHLDKGSVLVFSDSPKDYLPPVHTTWEGMECYNYSPLIYAINCENIAITGQGELRAEMGTWESWFSRPPAHMNSLKHLYNLAAKNVPVEERQMVNDTSNLRPQFIQFNRSKNILLEGVTITNSPFWVIHPYMSRDIVIRNVKVKAHGHNNDGVDPEMSQNILIEDCIFDQGDDAIAVKSGRNQDAWRLNAPTKNLVIQNCVVKNGHQLLAIGSELSGGIENVYMNNCEVVDGAKLNHLVYIKTNERRGGFVRNIFVDKVKSGKIDKGVLGIETDVLYQWRDLVPTYERRLTPIGQIKLTNFKAKSVDFISRIMGDKDMPITDVKLQNIMVDSVRVRAVINQNISGFILH